MANLIQSNNANIKIFGGKLSAGTVSGGGGGGGGPTATFWSNWSTVPNYIKTGSANFTVNGNNLEIDDRAGLTSFNSSYTYKGGSIDARDCTNLTTLNIGYTNLTSLNVSGCTSLTTLNCAYGLFTTLDVSSCTNLTTIYAWGSDNLTSINLLGATNLIHLDVQGSGFTQYVMDKILEDLVANGATNGALYAVWVVAPSDAGLANKAILQSRGWTIGGI